MQTIPPMILINFLRDSSRSDRDHPIGRGIISVSHWLTDCGFCDELMITEILSLRAILPGIFQNLRMNQSQYRFHREISA